MALTAKDLAREASGLLAQVRGQRPLVQNITNLVAMDISANVLLAAGASPAMVHALEEVEEFSAFADALVINTGTLSAPFRTSMILAAQAFGQADKPWVLDPVGAGATTFRNAALARLLALRPAIIRGNASEILALAKIAGLPGEDAMARGVDSRHSTGAAEGAAAALARHVGCIVAATGAVDVITDGAQFVRLGNGDAMMTKVTALGCALSALCAAFAAVTPDAFAAARSAIAVYAVAGGMAALQSSGPGSFRTALLDILHRIGQSDIDANLKVLP